jgi:hydroxymethylpyrimidine pyrophosphatase-like HAD family hydrolase
MPTTRVLFTDIDGTIVHYLSHSQGPTYEAAVLTLPPSTTGLCGTISETTLAGLARLRALPGLHLVIVSGARSSTLDRRLPYLPAADAVVAEGGGRLHWAGKRAAAGTPVLADLAEDMEWRRVHEAAAGPPSQGEGTPPAERVGELWDAYRSLVADGWTPDAAAYSTAFRLPLPADGRKSESDLAAALASLPPSLQTTTNLGCADVLPATSGKAAVGEWVMRALGADPADCAFLCDDANDLGLAAAVGRAFVVRATDPSLAAAAAADPAKFWTTSLDGNAAADAAVRAALAWAMGVGEDRRPQASSDPGGRGGRAGCAAVAGPA